MTRLELRKPGVRSKWVQVTVCGLALVAMLVFLCAPVVADEDANNVTAANTLIHGGKLDAAEVLLWKVLTEHPDNAEALNLLASIRLQQKRFAESETLLRRAISLSPDSLPARMNLGRVFHAQGETEKEVAALLDAARLAPNDAEVNQSLAAAYLKQNDFHLALEALERIPPAHRPDGVLPLLAASYLGLGRVADAQSLAPEVTARAAKNPSLRVEFAKVLLDFDFTNDALALLEIAQKQQAPSADLFFELGRARERKGELKLAQKDFQRAVDLNPTSVDALQALARMLASQEQWQKSVELLTRARTVAPDSPDVLRKFAAASLRAGRPADAVDAAQQLVKLRPDEPEALYLLGVAQLQNGDTEGARRTIENYAKLRPQDPLAFLALGMVGASLHDFPAARANFEQSIQLDPKHTEAYYQLAMMFRDQGDNRAAISLLEKALAIDTQHAQTHALLGTLYLMQQDYVKAQEHLTRAEELAPDSADTHYQLGLLFARLNQPDHAQREMDEFRKLKDKGHASPTPPGDRPAVSSSPYPPS
ncbi:MAG: tetratricopeptide repeat protein [Candidatus Sulfotelmatobacter sp.]